MGESETLERPKVIIVGAGLVGALNACFFGKRGWNVDVYEMREDIRTLPHVTGRSINLAMSHRSRQALAAVGLEESLLQIGTIMKARMIHKIDGGLAAQSYDIHGRGIFSIHRRRLNEIMMDEAEKTPNVKFHFSHRAEFVNFETNEVTFRRVNDSKVIVDAELILGCDGAHSAVRRSLMPFPMFNFSQYYIEDGYLELNILPTEDNKFAMSPHVFHLWPRGDFCLIALANTDKTFTVTLFAPFHIFHRLISDETVMDFFQTNFPDATKMMGRHHILEIFNSVKPSPLISVKCSPHHFGKGILLMGDAAHAMVPFYGQGMNAGFEDCLILHRLLDKHNDHIHASLKEYSHVRVADGHAVFDLALYNYKELRYLVNTWKYKMRKFLDGLLYRLLGKHWIPLYTMVTFTDIRYSTIVRIRARQDKIVSGLFWTTVATAIGFGVYRGVKEYRHSDISHLFSLDYWHWH